MHAFNIVATSDAVGDVPPTTKGNLVRWQIISDQRQQQHHHMFRHADTVRARYLGHGDRGMRRSRKIHMIGADTGGHRKLQFLCLGDPLLSQIGRPERLRNDHFRVRKKPFELRVRTILIASHDQLMASRLQVAAKAEFPETHPTSWPGLNPSGPLGVGAVWPSA